MPKLMRRHVNADMPREGVNNLDGKGGLTLPAAVPCYEEIAILVSAKPRQDLTAIPSKTPGNVIGNLAANISPFGLCVVGGNDFALDGGDATLQLIGRLVARGLDDELRGTAYAIIDGVDGRAHHVRLANLDAASDAAPGSIVELRQFHDAVGRRRVALAVRSDLSIDAQVQAGGATWLDRQLVAREPPSLSSGGFGHEVRDAMDARVKHLVAEGLAKRQGQRVIFARDMLDTLQRRELATTAARIDASTGLPYHPAREGEPVVGIYRQRLDLASGRFVLIDDELGFSLVPWSPSLERHLGRQVSGIVRSNRIEWSLQRARGPTIG